MARWFRRVNVPASRLILRLKIIRGPAVVTIREESWGAYLSESQPESASPSIFYSARNFTIL